MIFIYDFFLKSHLVHVNGNGFEAAKNYFTSKRFKLLHAASPQNESNVDVMKRTKSISYMRSCCPCSSCNCFLLCKGNIKTLLHQTKE